jgi:hypothetical protein
MVAKLRKIVDMYCLWDWNKIRAIVSKNIEHIQHDSGVRVWVINVARIDAKIQGYIGAWMVGRFVVCLEYITMRENGSAQRGLAHSLWSVISTRSLKKLCLHYVQNWWPDSVSLFCLGEKILMVPVSKTLIPSNCLRSFEFCDNFRGECEVYVL